MVCVYPSPLVFAAEDDPVQKLRALPALRRLRRRVSDFSIDFRTLVATAGWEPHALKAVFFQALDESLKDTLSCLDEPDSLDDFISLAIRLDNRMERSPHHPAPAPTVHRTYPPIFYTDLEMGLLPGTLKCHSGRRNRSMG